jgi:hypothetical protein
MPCEHIILKGPKKGLQCGKGSNDLCSVHRKIISRAEGLKTRRQEQTLAIDNIQMEPIVEQKTKTSDYAITINSQKDIDKLTEDELSTFKGINQWLYDNDGLMSYVEFIGDNKILSKFSSYNYEVGEKVGRLHTHGILQVKHQGKIKLDFAGLREWINDALGWKAHINIQVIKSGGTVGDWINYLNKRNSINII